MKVIDEYTIEIFNHKHTTLNIIRWCINAFDSETVALVGYTIPHPMEDKAVFKIQLKDENRQSKKEIVCVLRRGILASKKILEKIEKSI
ncbi:DNA-directed RNA polymerases I and III subunit RPAC2 [Nematocida sp. AWRm80]|nr:DNA-directed RNA polymerases I and III subunit RPAC2 [Nematocida sp. AWRm80]